MLGLDALHQIATSIWAGRAAPPRDAGGRAERGDLARARARGLLRLALGAVATLAVTGAALALAYVGGLDALLGTSYGGMLATKLTLFAGVARAGRAQLQRGAPAAARPRRPPARLRRFAEVEAGLGVTLLFVAASLGSGSARGGRGGRPRHPSGGARALHPRWPHLTTPSLAQLEAVSDLNDPLAPRTASDTAWSSTTTMSPGSSCWAWACSPRWTGWPG